MDVMNKVHFNVLSQKTLELTLLCELHSGVNYVLMNIS